MDDSLIIMYITLLFYLLYQYLGNIKYDVEKTNTQLWPSEKKLKILIFYLAFLLVL
jgi:hypothetical protein